MSSLVERNLPSVCGVDITAPDMQTALSEIMRLAKDATPSTVFTLNLDHAVKLQHDARFRAAYDYADVVTADGWPIAWIARKQDARVQRATGADIFLPLVTAAAVAQVPIYLFGTSPAVMARVGADLSLRTDRQIDIAGTLSPSNTFDPEGPEADAAIEKIRRSGAKLCFVALGAPKQEVFAARARQQGLACCMVCVGAALDFIAGEQVRAPKMMRENGLEWAWRLATNPKRLAKRYAQSGLMFAYLVATDVTRSRLRRPRSAH